ncbi:glutathione S-transferase 1-like [Tubulanus polymorphus]|uniref:glutathione S-transferase 1-like n=1 Tax=Tubulanus polymorphus TaxID=672921 RepID=UPI003DA47A8A
MAPINFYMMHVSSPCRGVWMVLKELGLEFNLKYTDLMKNEHMTPEFLKMNPQHCIPTVDDNGFIMWESRAIMLYLAEKYSKNSNFYPKDNPEKIYQINRFLFFDMDKMYGKTGQYIYPKMLEGKELDPEKEKAMKQSYDLLDGYLEGKKYVTGDHMTVADLSIAASVMFSTLIDYDISGWKNVSRWLNTMKKLPYFEECNSGLDSFKQYMKSRKGVVAHH